jgi:hypothetical protein
MCSTLEVRLALLRAAIDEVALATRTGRAGHADPGELAERLAGLWAMIAELDPALAARLHGYGPNADLDTPLCRHPGRVHGLPRSLLVIMPTATAAVGVRGLGPPGGYRGPTAKPARGRRAW